MPFSEKTKLEVKRKAAFACCRCRNIGVDVHHIIPEKDGGLDDVENAAPLCQNCHDQFGDNPSKRREITQMRDWWYETCNRMYSGKGEDQLPVLKEIDSKLDIMSRNIEGLRKDNQTNSTKLFSLTSGVEKLIQLALKILNRNYSNQ